MKRDSFLIMDGSRLTEWIHSAGDYTDRTDFTDEIEILFINFNTWVLKNWDDGDASKREIKSWYNTIREIRPICVIRDQSAQSAIPSEKSVIKESLLKKQQAAETALIGLNFCIFF